MRIAISLLAVTLAAVPAHAALSGFYDSAEQIGVILSSATVANALHQAPVGAISNTGTRKDGAREWTVRVQDCDLKVYLLPVMPNGVGKTTYEIEIPGVCK